MAKAYIIPALVAGILILTVGMGIFVANKSRTQSFAVEYNKSSTDFVASEIARVEKSMGEFKTIVFKVIPVIIIVACLLILFVDKPSWRAISATTIAMMTVIILVDSNANARLQTYHQELISVQNQIRK